MHPPVTVRDIARKCGLHFTTVALALRNSPKVAAATRARVQAQAARMGYRPNPLVSALMAQKRSQRKPDHASVLAHVSFSAPDYRPAPGSFEAEYLAGACQRCTEMGYRLETFHLHTTGLSAIRLAQILRTRAIPGLLLGSARGSKGHLPRPLHEFASIALSHSISCPALHRVSHNHCQGSMLACRSLRRKGYRRIGLVLTSLMDNRLSRLWTAGYLAFHEGQPKASRCAPLYLPYKELPARIAPEGHLHKLLLAWVRKETPDVILTMHLPLQQWLEENAGALPGKVEIASLDYSREWGNVCGVFQKPTMLGREAISFLVSQIQSNQYGIPAQPLTLMIEGEWREP